MAGTFLWDAIQAWEALQKSKRHTNHGNYHQTSATTTSAVNVVAVVVGISLRKNSRSPSSSSSAVELWIDDPSLHKPQARRGGDATATSKCVLVLYGCHARQSILTEKALHVGDICQFPAISIRQNAPQTGVYEFYPSREYCTQTEQEWRVVCRNSHYNCNSTNNLSMMTQQIAAEDSNNTSQHDSPNIMEPLTNVDTDQQSYIQTLVQWNRKSRQTPTKLSNATTLQQQQQQPTTSIIQRQTLEEMVASVGGVRRSVLVKVLRLEPMNCNGNATSKKRCRSSNCNSSQLLMATVSDGRHTNVPFVTTTRQSDPQQGRFQTLLEQALATGHWMWLHNVVCQKGQDVQTAAISSHDRRYWEDEVVLVPTSTTHLVVVVTTTDDDTTIQQSSLCQAQSFLMDATQDSQQQRRQKQQHQSSTATLHSTNSNAIVGEEGNMLHPVETTLRAIVFHRDTNGESSRTTTLTGKSKLWDSGEDLMKLLIYNAKDPHNPKKNAYGYRTATLLLDRWGNDDDGDDDHNQHKAVSVYADSVGMQHLCGAGLEARELFENPKLQASVGELLRGLLNEKEPLRWRLRRNNNGSPSGDSRMIQHDYLLQKVTLAETL